MKSNLLKISILIFIVLISLYTKVYAAENGTVRMEIKSGGTAWTNINVSDSYNECQSLNSSTSTLGTSMLKAHLTTDADWSAMAIFSVSQYGGSTTNSPTTTTGNNSGIYNVGTNSTQTTGILKTANANSTAYISGLFNNDGSVKTYIRQWDAVANADRDQTNFVSFMNSGTYGWLGSWTYWGTSTTYPISIKNGLFGVGFGLQRQLRFVWWAVQQCYI